MDIFSSMKDIFTNIGLFLIIIIAIILVAYSMESPRLVRYYVRSSPIDYDFVSSVKQIINSTNWRHYRVEESADEASADIVINLADRNEMEKWHTKKEYYPSGKEIRFSVTVQSKTRKPEIYIDAINWKDGVSESRLSLEQYRNYVIRHEFMHALGYDHQPCNINTAINGVCPILYQSTRGCPDGFKCGSQVTTVDFEKRLPVSYL